MILVHSMGLQTSPLCAIIHLKEGFVKRTLDLAPAVGVGVCCRAGSKSDLDQGLLPNVLGAIWLKNCFLLSLGDFESEQLHCKIGGKHLIHLIAVHSLLFLLCCYGVASFG